MITWQEFEDWYMDEQDQETKELKHAEVINGPLVLYEGKMICPTSRVIDPKVELMVPIFLKKYNCTWLFIVYDNQEAILYNYSDMKILHRVCFTPNYDIKVSNRVKEIPKDHSIIKNNIFNASKRCVSIPEKAK